MAFFSKQARLVQVAAVLMFLFIASSVDALQPSPRIDSTNNKLNDISQNELEKRLPSKEQQNKTVETRIQLQEPYKSLVQSSARFAIIQTKLTNLVSVETTMSLLNEVGFALSKPSTLVKVVKVIAVSIAAFLATSFLFPGAYRFVDALWRDPYNTLKLDKYLVNGVSERSVLKILHSRIDETLSESGLYDNSCRERTICHGAELIRQMFPDAAEMATKFAYEHRIIPNFDGNKYFKAFSYGFFDKNCSAITINSDHPGTDNCLGHVLKSILQSRLKAAYQPETSKYQTIEVGRATNNREIINERKNS